MIILNLHHLFVPTESIICIFFIFRPSKTPRVVPSLSPLRCRLSSGRRRHVAASCHACFPLSQDELAVSSSSSVNGSSYHLLSQVKTEALNPHRRRRAPSSYSPTLTIHGYKNIISILLTLSITQSHLYCASSLAEHHVIRAPPATVISFHRRPTSIIYSHNDIYGDKLTDHLLFSEQLIDM
jgi:hypothetical protein